VEWRYFVKNLTHTELKNHRKMKRIAKSVLKGLLIVVLFTGGTVVLSTTGVKTVNEANAATYNQVYEYLVTNGYTVLTLEPKAGTKYDWIAQTSKNGVRYLTTIYCTDLCVVGNADIPM
jgi:hypothetical protein